MDPVNRFNNTSWVAIVTPINRIKSVGNRYVIEIFGGVFELSRCFLDLSVCRAFDKVMIQISSLFSKCYKTDVFVKHECPGDNKVQHLLFSL